MATIPLLPGKLRHAAEAIEQSTGLRVEIIGGALLLSPPRRGKHAGTVRQLRERIGSRLPGLGAYEAASIAFPGDEDDYATPDLAVLPARWENQHSSR
ncbi:hypothetical protein AB0O82_33730 [Kitasatospora sp. NPDC088264]|uniref:hypothetical protein n=1 Tax=unclassified Kitasatospora TaxID=2633591 RepID=UPI00341BD4E8